MTIAGRVEYRPAATDKRTTGATPVCSWTGITVETRHPLLAEQRESTHVAELIPKESPMTSANRQAMSTDAETSATAGRVPTNTHRYTGE